MKGSCILVMTIWYVHEALRDGNKDRARDLCTEIEALSRQVPCLWIRLRTQLQEDEVAEEFFKSIGAQHERRKPFCEEAVAIFPNHEKLQDIEKARSEGLLWFFSKPELFGEALKNQRTYPDVKTELKTAVQITVGRKGLLNEARKQYVKKFLPAESPGGVVVPDESKRRFLEQMDITKFRALSFEAGLSEATTADTQARPTEQDSVDLQHAVSAVPYVDVAILDGKFCKYVRTVKKKWRGDKPLAECFDNFAEALDWIEKERPKP